MKLYSYSSELLIFIETKWVKTKFAIIGIFIGIVILLGVIELNQSVGFAFGSRSAITLASENNFLQQQVSQISPRVSKLEIQALQLDKYANNLYTLLSHHKIANDTVSSFSSTSKEFKPQSMILAMKSIRP